MGNFKYAIIGSGAIGGYYGGKLAYAGNQVHFLLRSDYEHVRNHGLRVDSVSGGFILEKVNAYQSVSDMPVCDIILVCLKTTSNIILDQLLPKILHPDSVVILLQNGIGEEEELKRKLPHINIAGGLAFICAEKIGQGHIAHIDYGKLTLGEYRMASNQVLEQVAQDFSMAGVNCKLTNNLSEARWQKLLWNIPFNGLSTLLNANTKQLLGSTEIKQMIHGIMLEIIHGASHCGVQMKIEHIQNMLEYTEKMKPYFPSMKIDYDNRRPLEVESIYSRPIREAAKSGAKMLMVSMLEKQLRFFQSQILNPYSCETDPFVSEPDLVQPSFMPEEPQQQDTGKQSFSIQDEELNEKMPYTAFDKQADEIGNNDN